MTDPDDLIVTALNAMAASQDGWTNMHDLMAHLETRLGSTDEEAKDSRSTQSRSFRETFMRLVSAGGGSGSIIDRGFAQYDDTGGRLQITDAGRRFIGR